MKKATKVMLGLVAVLVALSMIGCGGEVDLTPTYLFQKTATIDAADGTVTLEGTDVTWSIKGCDNGDTDPNNDLATYDATGKIYLDGNVVKVVDGYDTNGENVVVRVFGTSTKDSYLYGWYDITLNIEAPAKPLEITKTSPVNLTANVGANDFTSGFWATFGDIWEVPAGEGRIVKFKNTNAGSGDVWKNFIVILQTTATGHSFDSSNPNYVEGYAEYAVVRSDNWGWGSGYKNNADLILENNWDWTNFVANLNGATVTVEVQNKGLVADVLINVLTADEKTFYQNYKNITTNNGPLYFCLSVENAYLEPIVVEEGEGGEPSVAGQVANGSWDFADLATVTVDYANGATKIESAEALAAATSAGTAMPEAKFYLKGDVEYSSTTGSMKAVVKSLDEEGLPILYNKYEATKDLGEFSVGCLQGTKDFMVVEKVQGPFTVTMNYSTNSSSDKTDRYAYIKINGEENKDSAYPESVPSAGSTMTVDYTGTDVVDVVFGATNSVRVYDVTFTAK